MKEEYLVIILGYLFLFLLKNICCGYSLEAPRRGASNEYPQHIFLLRNKKNYPRIITKYSSLTTPLFNTFKEKQHCPRIIGDERSWLTMHFDANLTKIG